MGEVGLEQRRLKDAKAHDHQDAQAQQADPDDDDLGLADLLHPEDVERDNNEQEQERRAPEREVGQDDEVGAKPMSAKELLSSSATHRPRPATVPARGPKTRSR